MKKIILSLIFVFIALVGIANVSACDMCNCTADDCQPNSDIWICGSNGGNNEITELGENNTVDYCTQQDLENNITSDECPDNFISTSPYQIIMRVPNN